MKKVVMLMIAVALVCLLPVCLTGRLAQGQAKKDTAQKGDIQCKVTLRNDSSFGGVVKLSGLSVKTDEGVQKIAAEQLMYLIVGGEGLEDTVVTEDKTYNGAIELKEFELDTGYGVLKIPLKDVANIRILSVGEEKVKQELIYRLKFPGGASNDEKRKLFKKTTDVLSRRLDACGLGKVDFAKKGDDCLVVKFPKDAVLADYRKIFRTVGRLELKEVGDKKLHEKHKPDPKTEAPEGYMLIKNTKGSGNDEFIKSEYLWVKKENVITGDHIVNARADFGMNGWKIDFRLDEEATKHFAEVTERLASKGYIAIILDGKLVSRPFVRSAIKSGDGVIDMGASSKKQDADTLAIVLRAGVLPVQLEEVTADEKKDKAKQK